MTDLAELLARVESASGPDTGVDAAITAWLANAIVKPYPPSDDFGPHDRWQFWSKDGEHFLGSEGKFKVAPVTTSVDAAIALCERVLPKAQWSICRDNLDPPFEALVEHGRIKEWHEHSAPALALCAAILKAVASRDRP